MKSTFEEIAKRVNASAFDPILWRPAIEALVRRDASGFLSKADNMDGPGIVRDNEDLLRDLGIYEAALLHAYVGVRVDTAVPLDIKEQFSRADRDRLRAAGEPIPGRGPFVLYQGEQVLRGCRQRQPSGISWTRRLGLAAWFAERLIESSCRPVVWRATIGRGHIVAYTNVREEDEFIVVHLPKSIKVEQVPEAKCKAATAAYVADRAASSDARRKRFLTKWARRRKGARVRPS
jgi:hypothetical protein